MTRDQAREVVALIAECFGVQPPTLRWSLRARNGLFLVQRRQIVVGPRCWRGVEATLLHEMAHHVLHHERRGLRRGGGRQCDIHGPAFSDTLHRIAEHWYGTAIRYPWDTEYASVRRFFAAIERVEAGG